MTELCPRCKGSGVEPDLCGACRACDGESLLDRARAAQSEAIRLTQESVSKCPVCGGYACGITAVDGRPKRTCEPVAVEQVATFGTVWRHKGS